MEEEASSLWSLVILHTFRMQEDLLTRWERMKKSIYSPKADFLVNRIKELRKQAGLTQREFAAKLEVPRGTVGRIELGDRRIDVAEFHTILEILEVDPEKEFRAIALEFSSLSGDEK